MHISLRTAFVIVTTVAVYLALNVGLYQDVGPAAASRAVYLAALLPLVLIWVTAAAWAIANRRQLAGVNLVLWALGLNLGGRLAVEGLYSLAYSQSMNSGYNQASVLFAVSSFLSIATSTISWGLVLLAFARANWGRGEERDTQSGREHVATASPWTDRNSG